MSGSDSGKRTRSVEWLNLPLLAVVWLTLVMFVIVALPLAVQWLWPGPPNAPGDRRYWLWYLEQGGNPAERRDAVRILLVNWADAPEVCSAVRTAILSDPDPAVRREGLIFSAGIPKLRPTILQAAADNDPSVRATVQGILSGCIGGPKRELKWDAASSVPP